GLQSTTFLAKPMLVLNETEIRDLAGAAEAHSVVEEAFRALQRGEATLPGVISLAFRSPEGIAHIKAGHLHDDAVWTVKVSTDIEPAGGGPTLHNRLMGGISGVDGALAGRLLDHGVPAE